MGRIILSMQMSMDGVISNEDRWMLLNEEIFDDYLDYYNSVETIIVGGNSYFDLAQHWQSAENSKNDLERAIAMRLNEIPKVVISSSEIDLVWRNSRQIMSKDDKSLAREIENLKNSTGKISVESGVKTWQLFVQNDLFDDLWLLVHPVVVSEGEKLFTHAKNQFSMNLISSKTYDNGVVGLYYQKVNEK